MVQLRHIPTQARSRERLQRVLDAADELLAADGPAAFTTTRIAELADVPVGSVYRFFDDKQAIVEALAVRYWSDFAAVVATVAERCTGGERLEDPVGEVIDALAGGFRAAPGFRALWYGGLRTERVRAATRPARAGITESVVEILGAHWRRAPETAVRAAAEMVVLAGDGLLREAFRREAGGDSALLAESKAMVAAYLAARLGARTG
jgi:AcrR family transcriptional regulator